jgi:hypothetical protein
MIFFPPLLDLISNFHHKTKESRKANRFRKFEQKIVHRVMSITLRRIIVRNILHCMVAICAFSSLACFAATKPIDPDEADTTDVLAIPLDTSADEEVQDQKAFEKMEAKKQMPQK